MKIIKREKYLDTLINVIDTPDIKVITGVRRCGKSKLLDELKMYIEKNIKNNNIIYVNFSLHNTINIMKSELLYKYIEDRYKEGCNNFVLIDEVQMCEDFEKVINWIHAEEKFDIYITGSNAFLLSSDLATLFTGRTFELELYPFSYGEYLKYYNQERSDKTFNDYLLNGGLSGSYLYSDGNEKYKYINDVYKTLIIRDIVNKYKIQNESLLDTLTDFLMDNVSNITSIRNISNILNNNHIATNDKIISRYITYLCNAFMFYKIRRFDIQGKKYLSSQDKYYLVDHSFKFAKLGTKNINYGRVLENIVAIELLRQGYEVYVGVLNNKEIDFVAMKRNEKVYIQVSDDISNDETFHREVAPLLKIHDAYPRMIIARTHHEKYQYEGIQIVNIVDWLS